ncbi:hypothetical protein PQ455_10285 [Sphingomonas naphthae]|uniref:DUF4345 domain-containing protein n=1 Tax=Sphingomonas naphthae TaxID=1813468 RepID=A0ABY7TFV4_9SPHN|nr:hypothetical protein [Sphingomonas naphthae]WCT72035.1 hypothetical protein PQ455_10285 [Sphingomonas naphthae]
MVRPISIMLGCALIVLSAAMSLFGGWARYAALSEMAEMSGAGENAGAMASIQAIFVGSALIAGLFLSGMAALIWYARSTAARLALTVVLAIGLVWTYVLSATGPTGLGTLQSAVDVAALILLWLPASSAFLAGRTPPPTTLQR